MKNIVLLLMIIYLSCCALLYFGQRALLYFPTVSDQIDGVTTIKFKNNGVELNGWIVNPAQDEAILYYGGNAEKIEQNILLFAELFQGRSVYLIPYQGYGNSQGWPSESRLYSDALYIYDQLAPRHKKISLLGRSLGSGIATYVASLRDIDKLILVTPYDSIESVAQATYWIFPVSILLKDKYNSIDRVVNIKATTLILIAERDRIIARRHSDNLLAAFEPGQIESVIIAGAGHNDIADYAQYPAAIRHFFKASKY